MQDYMWVSKKTGNKYWTRDEARHNKDGQVVKYYSVHERTHPWGHDYFWGVEVVHSDKDQTVIMADSREHARDIMERIEDPHKVIRKMRVRKYIHEGYYKHLQEI